MSVKPPALKRGDLIRVIAPASPFDRTRLADGAKVLEAMGFRVDWREDVFATAGYLAGGDARRADELMAAFRDPQVRGIVCARGGYGTPRILDRLDYAEIAKHAKVFCGFSDVTALLLAFHTRAGMVSFHGPNATGRMAEHGLDPPEITSFVATVGTSAPAGRVAKGETLHPGAAAGPLLGGNLAMVTALLGTPYAPDFEGAILFLEDVGEKFFRLDRMLTQLRLAGVLDRVAGIAFGRFSGCTNPPDPAARVEDLLASFASAAGKPCIAGLPFGHDGDNRTLPVGVRAEIGGGALTVVEAAVS